MKRLLTTTLLATLFVGLSACSDDKKSGSPGDGGQSASTIPGNIAIPGVSKECSAIIAAMANAQIAATGQGDAAQAAATFTALAASVPAELKDSATVWAAAYSELVAVLKAHGYNYQEAMKDPKAEAALDKVNSEEVSKAGDAISAYIDSSCKAK